MSKSVWEWTRIRQGLGVGDKEPAIPPPPTLDTLPSHTSLPALSELPPLSELPLRPDDLPPPPACWGVWGEGEDGQHRG